MACRNGKDGGSGARRRIDEILQRRRDAGQQALASVVHEIEDGVVQLAVIGNGMMLSVSATHLQSVGVTVQGYAIQFCGMVFADRDVQLLEGRGDGRTSSMVAVLRFAMVATKLPGVRAESGSTSRRNAL